MSTKRMNDELPATLPALKIYERSIVDDIKEQKRRVKYLEALHAECCKRIKGMEYERRQQERNNPPGY